MTGSTARADEVGLAFSVARGGFTYGVLGRLGLADDVRRQVVDGMVRRPPGDAPHGSDLVDDRRGAAE